MAVLAPMPIASESSATAVKPGRPGQRSHGVAHITPEMFELELHQ